MKLYYNNISSEKSDLKDPKTIALLVKDGRYSTSYFPGGVYAEIREASVCRDQIMKQHVRLSNQIQGWLQKLFPEYLECYANWDSTSGLMLLKEAPLPQNILKLGVGGINMAECQGLCCRNKEGADLGRSGTEQCRPERRRGGKA